MAAAWGVCLAQTGGQAPANAVGGGLVRLMAFDANSDGRLTEAEVADPRLAPLLKRADTNQDGSVTREELAEQLQREMTQILTGRGGGPGTGPGSLPPGPDAPRQPGGSGVPGAAPGGRPPQRPLFGQVMPGRVQDALNLSPEQREQLRDLQSDVDARLRKILSEDQQRQLQQLRDRGPGRPGGPGGPNGAPGGGPPRQ